jgi:hypothetical protein
MSDVECGRMGGEADLVNCSKVEGYGAYDNEDASGLEST